MRMNDLSSLYLRSPRLNQLNILREVYANPAVTQADLAKLCSLSVAMVNNYMKELCGKGLLEYRRKSIKSVTYHLTPSGVHHLETLQSELIDEMVGMFTAAKEQIRNRILSQAPEALQRVILFGSGHLAQLAFHALELTGVRVLGICDDDIEAIGGDFCGREVLSASQIRYLEPDALIVADSARADEICKSLEFLAEKGISLICLNKMAQQRAAEMPKNVPQPSVSLI